MRGIPYFSILPSDRGTRLPRPNLKNDAHHRDPGDRFFLFLFFLSFRSDDCVTFAPANNPSVTTLETKKRRSVRNVPVRDELEFFQTDDSLVLVLYRSGF